MTTKRSHQLVINKEKFSKRCNSTTSATWQRTTDRLLMCVSSLPVSKTSPTLITSSMSTTALTLPGLLATTNSLTGAMLNTRLSLATSAAPEGRKIALPLYSPRPTLIPSIGSMPVLSLLSKTRASVAHAGLFPQLDPSRVLISSLLASFSPSPSSSSLIAHFSCTVTLDAMVALLPTHTITI